MVPVEANEWKRGMDFDKDVQLEISDAIDEAVSELRIGKDVNEFPVKVTIKLVDDISLLNGKTTAIRKLLKEKNIPYKTNFLFDDYPAMTRDYFFKNEQHALLFLLSCNDH